MVRGPVQPLPRDTSPRKLRQNNTVLHHHDSRWAPSKSEIGNQKVALVGGTRTDYLSRKSGESSAERITPGSTMTTNTR